MADGKKNDRQPIEFSEECAMLLSSAGDFVSTHSTIEKVRGLIEAEAGYNPEVWTQMAQLGWMGVALPEEHGGAGMGVTALVAIIEPMGRGLLGSPFVTSTLAGQLLLALGDDGQKQAWLPKLASGDAIATLALQDLDGSWSTEETQATAKKQGDSYLLTANKHQVLDAAHADFLLVSASVDGQVEVFLVDREALPEGALTRHVILDETRRAHALTLSGFEVPASARLGAGDTKAALTRTATLGSLLMAAEMTGVCQASMDLTLEYLRTRKQFGKLIGGYQALKHPMVDIMVQHDQARSLLYAAATAFDGDPASKATRTSVHMAKAQAGLATTEAVDRGVQFHGAMGFTYECHAQLYFRRTQWAEYAYGDTMHHRRKLADLVLD